MIVFSNNCKKLTLVSVQFLDQMNCQRGMRDDSTEILFQSFLQKTIISSSGTGKGCAFVDTVNLALPLLTTTLPTHPPQCPEECFGDCCDT